MKTLSFVTVLIFGLAQDCIADEQDPVNASKTMLAQWECMTFAKYAGDEKAAERHFETGLSDGRLFIAAAYNDEIPKDAYQKSVPMIVGMTMQGPSNEFILGRLYEAISSYATEQVSKRAEIGPQSLEHDFDPELMTSKAINLYQKKNCELLK